MPGLIDQYRKNMPRAKFLSSQELQDLVRAKTPFYITQIFEGTGNFNGKEVHKWQLRCVPMLGGPEFLFSLGKTPYRDGLVDVLQPVIGKEGKVGPLVLTFGIGKASGRPMYDLEDFMPGQSASPPLATPAPVLSSPTYPAPIPPMPGSPVSAVKTEAKQYTALCSLCNTYPVTDEPFNWNGKLYLPHLCKVSGKQEMLVIEPA